MNKILTLVVVIAVIIILFVSMSSSQNMTVVHTGNDTKQPIKIVLGKFQDSDCGMIIDDITFASQVIAPDETGIFRFDGTDWHTINVY